MIVPVGIAFGLAVLGIILVLLLRRHLREKYAVLWLVVGLAILVLALFPGLLFGLSDALGVEVPSNLLFALALALLVGVTLHLSWELSRAEEEVRRLAEDVAILRLLVDDMRNVRSSGPVAEDVPDRGNHGPEDPDAHPGASNPASW